MTLLLREIGQFLVESGLWLVAVAAVTAITALPVFWLARRRVDLRSTDLQLAGLCFLGAAALAALAHRIGATALAPDIGGRPLPVLWAAAGSLATSAVIAARARRAS